MNVVQTATDLDRAAQVRDAASDYVMVFWDGGCVSTLLPAHGTLLLGRGEECDVRIDHPSVSRRHAALVVGDDVKLVDLGSSNGTRVGASVLVPHQPASLAPGAVAALSGATLVIHHGALAMRRPNVPAPSVGRWEAGVIVRDDAMRRLYELATVIGPANISVLVHGETGVGKEILARHIHGSSTRRDRPFVSINCAALPESLVESELFGHERGAFTGASQTKVGLLESADGGTVFLDEIGELPLSAQAKVLRAIESKEVLRVGTVRARPVDVRFVSATHRRLEDAIEHGSFREDLFYRLNGITLSVPALRDRSEEIVELAQCFLDNARRSAGRDLCELSPDSIAALRSHRWPGNVRELRNAMERAALLCLGHVVHPAHFEAPTLATTVAPPPAPSPPAATVADAGSLTSEMAALEKQRILEALERCAGNQTRAASALGIKRGVLVKRLETYGIARPRKLAPPPSRP